jgi:chemotaxis protein methyltransferase CheR
LISEIQKIVPVKPYPMPSNHNLTPFLTALYDTYGYDYRHYHPAHIRRGIEQFIQRTEISGAGATHASPLQALQKRLLADPALMRQLVIALSIPTTEMFRHPSFFSIFRREVVPHLATYPFIRIWHAGCSTGQEVYSMAILLAETGLYERSRLYATDINEEALTTAQEGVYPILGIQEATRNYRAAGGDHPFSTYYTASHQHAALLSSLKRNITFAVHNLVTDASFNAFHVIICRNTLIYFDPTLSDRVHNLFYDSLIHFGFLGLGDAETIHFTPHEKDYQTINNREKIYRRKG